MKDSVYGPALTSHSERERLFLGGAQNPNERDMECESDIWNLRCILTSQGPLTLSTDHGPDFSCVVHSNRHVETSIAITMWRPP